MTFIRGKVVRVGEIHFCPHYVPTFEGNVMGLGMGVGRRGSKAIPTPTPTPIPPPTMGPAGTCKRGRGMELGFVDLDLGGKGVRKGSDPMNAPTVPTPE